VIGMPPFRFFLVFPNNYVVSQLILSSLNKIGIAFEELDYTEPFYYFVHLTLQIDFKICSSQDESVYVLNLINYRNHAINGLLVGFQIPIFSLSKKLLSYCITPSVKFSNDNEETDALNYNTITSRANFS
jgi:hypothetical protein